MTANDLNILPLAPFHIVAAADDDGVMSIEHLKTFAVNRLDE